MICRQVSNTSVTSKTPSPSSKPPSNPSRPHSRNPNRLPMASTHPCHGLITVSTPRTTKTKTAISQWMPPALQASPLPSQHKPKHPPPPRQSPNRSPPPLPSIHSTPSTSLLTTPSSPFHCQLLSPSNSINSTITLSNRRRRVPTLTTALTLRCRLLPRHCQRSCRAIRSEVTKPHLRC